MCHEINNTSIFLLEETSARFSVKFPNFAHLNFLNSKTHHRFTTFFVTLRSFEGLKLLNLSTFRLIKKISKYFGLKCLQAHF